MYNLLTTLSRYHSDDTICLSYRFEINMTDISLLSCTSVYQVSDVGQNSVTIMELIITCLQKSVYFYYEKQPLLSWTVDLSKLIYHINACIVHASIFVCGSIYITLSGKPVSYRNTLVLYIFLQKICNHVNLRIINKWNCVIKRQYHSI